MQDSLGMQGHVSVGDNAFTWLIAGCRILNLQRANDEQILELVRDERVVEKRRPS
jgi:hypothetical protein